MSARQWKPGDVAMVSAYNRPEPYRAHFDGKTWREYAGNAFCVDQPTSHRPLVVIDPEDRAQVARLLTIYLTEYDGMDSRPQKGEVRCMQAALRRLIADPKPKVYAHLRLGVSDDGVSSSVCGKVWRAGEDAEVVGKCPNCRDLVREWVS